MRTGDCDRPEVQERFSRKRLRLRARYTCANDVSTRDWQFQWAARSGAAARRSTPSPRWAPAWSPPTRSPIPNALAIKLDINGEVLQDWNTDDMIFDVPSLIEFLSGSTTFSAGHGDSHRHPAGRGLLAKTSALSQGRRRVQRDDREDRHVEQSGCRGSVNLRDHATGTIRRNQPFTN